MGSTKALYTPGLCEQSRVLAEGFNNKSVSWIQKYKKNIKINEEKNELIGLQFVDTQAWSVESLGSTP